MKNRAYVAAVIFAGLVVCAGAIIRYPQSWVFDSTAPAPAPASYIPEFDSTVLVGEMNVTNQPSPDTSFVDTNDLTFPGTTFDPTFIAASATISPYYSFDGSQDYLDAQNETFFDFQRTALFTISVWINHDALATEYIMSKQISTGKQEGYQFLTISSGEIQFALVGQVTPSIDRLRERTVWVETAEVWHNVTVTYDGSSTAAGLKFYINGIEEVTTILDNNLSISMTQDLPLRIGGRDGGSLPFDGGIDRPIVWSGTNLAAADVDTLFWNTATNYGWMNFDKDNRDQHSNTTFILSAEYGGISADTSYVGTNHAALPGTIYDPTWTTEVWTNGSVVGTNGFWEFDGSDDFLYVGNEADHDFSTNDAFSLSIWANADVLTQQELIAKSQNGVNGGWNFRQQAATGYLLFLFVDTSGNNNNIQGTTRALAIGEWVHCVATYDGSGSTNGMVMYTNGIQIVNMTSNEGMTSDMTGNGRRARVGARCLNAGISPSAFFNGSLDEARIYNAALSSNEVSTLWTDTKQEHPNP